MRLGRQILATQSRVAIGAARPVTVLSIPEMGELYL